MGTNRKTLDGVFKVTHASQEHLSVIPRRRRDFVRPFSTLSREDAFKMTDEWLARCDPEYVGASTFEMPWRPIPYATPRSEFAGVVDILRRMLPHVRKFTLAHARVGVGAYEKSSRIGWPYFDFSDDKAYVVAQHIPDVLAGRFSFKDAFTTFNVRLQAERASKEREYLFVNAEKSVFSMTITAAERTDKETGRLASRTRTVANCPIPNLITQIADNAFHNGFLSMPTFHHDVTGMARRHTLPRYPHTIAFDFRHFERVTGLATEMWADCIGGLYGDLIRQLLATPFLVPAIGSGESHWKPTFVEVNNPAYVMQLGSGLSTVSVIQKILMLATYAAYFADTMKMADDEAVIRVATQQIPGVQIFNYGDDNLVSASDKGVLDHMFAWLNERYHVEIEEPTAFLGFILHEERGQGFRLSRQKWSRNWVLNERQPGSMFRPLPYFGWHQRNGVYREIGEDGVGEDIRWVEDELMPKYGLTKRFVDEQVARERLLASNREEYTNELVMLDKSYLLTDADKARLTNQYSVLGHDLCVAAYNALVPSHH